MLSEKNVYSIAYDYSVNSNFYIACDCDRLSPQWSLTMHVFMLHEYFSIFFLESKPIPNWLFGDQ